MPDIGVTELKFGCSLDFELQQSTPMIVLLNVHHSRASDLVIPDRLKTTPSVSIESYRDGFGNWCARVVAPPGSFRLGTDGVIRDDGESDPMGFDAVQQPIEFLPPDVLTFLLPSRFCESDLMFDLAWSLFSKTQPGWSRVQAICDHVHQTVTFGYEHSRPTRTAAETRSEGRGVCRDFAHLAIALCRAMNIPARYCTGYASDIGQSSPFAAMDFAAWMEVYLGGRWWVFDPRNNDIRFGRILIARGRDAADVPLTHSFGPNVLNFFHVWIEPT